VVKDSLGIGGDLERAMQSLVDTYECEWTGVVRDPAKRGLFRHFAADTSGDPSIRLVPERGQLRPADSPPTPPAPSQAAVRRLPIVRRTWVRVAAVTDVPTDTGIAVRYGDTQLAVFRLDERAAGPDRASPASGWYATQNMCPHARQMVLARGIVGDHGGAPKVACPLHKKTFDLQTGACLSGEALAIATFPVRVDGDAVFVELPPAEDLRTTCDAAEACAEGVQAIAS
jgi:NAD(P)H-dependent nitrite reductase small subunit